MSKLESNQSKNLTNFLKLFKKLQLELKYGRRNYSIL